MRSLAATAPAIGIVGYGYYPRAPALKNSTDFLSHSFGDFMEKQYLCAP